MTHLTGEYTDAELIALTQQLRDHEVPENKIQKSLQVLGDLRYGPARRAFEQYLDHPNPFVRVEAVLGLTLWLKCQDHRRTCQRLLETDAVFDVRSAAVTGFASLVAETRDAEGLQYLAAIVRDPKCELLIREAAYHAILGCADPTPSRPHIRSEERLAAGVDWDLLSRIDEGTIP